MSQLTFVPICIFIAPTATNNLPLFQYISEGLSCFIGITPSHLTPNTCDYATITYAVYVVVIVTYYFLYLYLTKKTTSLLSLLVSKAVVIVSVFMFLIEWPIIGTTDITYLEFVSLSLIFTGLFLFQVTSKTKEEYHLSCCSCFLPFCLNQPIMMTPPVKNV